jgi:cell division protein FtsB
VSLARWWPIPLLIGVAALLAGLDSHAGMRAWWDLRATLREAETERAELQREVDHLRAEADALESDGFAIERAIRERLRLAKAGETVVRLSNPETASPRFP